MVSKNRRIWKIIGKLTLAFIALALIFAGVAWGYYRYQFPYGWNHCCIVQFGPAFQFYADDHNGKFPSGQTTPEASLSLLAKGDYGIGPDLLCGKTVPMEVARAALAKDGVLGPESCSCITLKA